MNALRALAVTAAASVAAAYVVACAAPAAQKTLVVDCDKSEGSDCKEQDSKSSTRKGGSSSSSSSSEESPSTEETETETAKTSDAGADASADAAPTTGPRCTALEACCKVLEKQGYTGSVRQCREVVKAGSEFGCTSTLDGYQNPDPADELDPICQGL